MAKSFSTRSSSVDRAFDQIGDKWSLLIIQEVFWGINTFNEMMKATGMSRGVLSERLNRLQDLGCLQKKVPADNPRRPAYHLTKKSVDLYDSALMAIGWERKYYNTPALDSVELMHELCGSVFVPQMRCVHCGEEIRASDVSYRFGPGHQQDERLMKVRRRSSISVLDVPSSRALYKNLINVVGDRWTANVIALAFHGYKRFDEFHEGLPVATNILSDRLKLLVADGIFRQVPYLQSPLRYEYHLTDKGRDLYPYFLAILQWGDRWCGQGNGRPMLLTHKNCGHELGAKVCCSTCGEHLQASEVKFTL